MAKAVKKAATKKSEVIVVGNITIELGTLAESVVAKADARIQKKVQPIFGEIRRARRAAALSSSKIILNV